MDCQSDLVTCSDLEAVGNGIKAKVVKVEVVGELSFRDDVDLGEITLSTIKSVREVVELPEPRINQLDFLLKINSFIRAEAVLPGGIITSEHKREFFCGLN